MQLPEFLTEDPDGLIHVKGRRVGLEQLVHYYNEGYSVEALACEFPSVSLPIVHKVLAFYLENRAEVDAYVASSDEECERQRKETPQGPSLQELRRRSEARRHAQGA